MKLSNFTAVLLSIFITVSGCSEPEESGRMARAKYDELKDIADPVIERAKSDSQSFISGFLEEKEANNDANNKKNK